MCRWSRVLTKQLGGEPADVARRVIEREPDARESARARGATELREGELDDLGVGVLERGEEGVVACRAAERAREPRPLRWRPPSRRCERAAERREARGLLSASASARSAAATVAGSREASEQRDERLGAVQAPERTHGREDDLGLLVGQRERDGIGRACVALPVSTRRRRDRRQRLDRVTSRARVAVRERPPEGTTRRSVAHRGPRASASMMMHPMHGLRAARVELREESARLVLVARSQLVKGGVAGVGHAWVAVQRERATLRRSVAAPARPNTRIAARSTSVDGSRSASRITASTSVSSSGGESTGTSESVAPRTFGAAVRPASISGCERLFAEHLQRHLGAVRELRVAQRIDEHGDVVRVAHQAERRDRRAACVRVLFAPAAIARTVSCARSDGRIVALAVSTTSASSGSASTASPSAMTASRATIGGDVAHGVRQRADRVHLARRCRGGERVALEDGVLGERLDRAPRELRLEPRERVERRRA